MIQWMNIFYNLFVGETIATGILMVELDRIEYCKQKMNAGHWPLQKNTRTVALVA